MSDKKDYKATLNLPRTEFPMKAGLTRLEPKLLERWKQENLYQKIVQRRRDQGAAPWVLHDGPPYANGHIHMGHSLNKILKDIIIKSKSMAGFYSPYIPGWDCHGLPIEHKVDKELGAKKREMSQGDIRRQCRMYAEKYVAIQSEEFQRLGVFGEWDKPYLTMKYDYEATIARELGKFILSGSVYQSPKPVLWCGSCRTALAEAEVEYENHKSNTVYVAFPLKDDPAALDEKLAGRRVALAIWTTTPWTLPSNMAIVYNPEITYGAYQAQAEDGQVLILAQALAETVGRKMGRALDLVCLIDPARLNGLKAVHPIYGRDSLIAPAGYVTLDQGTGLVHTAPGHGREDFETGVALKLPVFSPLDDLARFTAEIPEWEGLHVLAANKPIIEKLKELGVLLAQEDIEHQYPHCWRCKKPVVFRSTPQWFISMEKNDLRAKALAEIGQVRWVPKWGRERIYGMIEFRPDWCISRQRSWGVPITIFLCRNCGQWHYSQAIMDHLFKIIKAKGADAWYDLPVEDLLPPGEKCSCGAADFEKETDILDVWFDSGCSFVDTMEGRDYLPDMTSMYLEGSDQHRGWFHSSLLISVGTRDRAPYKEVLTHGYVVDGAGRKQSKSLGNTIAPDDVINKYGADILRLWVAAENYQDDIRLSNQILDMLAKAYFNFRNTSRFILGNLFDFDFQKDAVPYADLNEMDRFILHDLNQLTMKILEAYDEYDFHVIYHLINNFVVDISAFYHDVIKDRLYTLAPGDPKRRSAQTVMRLVLAAMARLMAPVLSFTCEEIWDHLPGAEGSVFLTDFPAFNPEWHQPELAARWETLLRIRGRVNKVLEEARREKIIGAPLDAQVTLTASGATLELLRRYQAELADIFIVSGVAAHEDSSLEEDEGLTLKAQVASSSFAKCPRCWVHDPAVPADQSRLCPKCQTALA